MSPKDIVVAKQRDLDDHIEWLVERCRYEEALKAAESATGLGRLTVSDVVDIGVKYLGSLMAQGKKNIKRSFYSLDPIFIFLAIS